MGHNTDSASKNNIFNNNVRLNKEQQKTPKVDPKKSAYDKIVELVNEEPMRVKQQPKVDTKKSIHIKV